MPAVRRSGSSPFKLHLHRALKGVTVNVHAAIGVQTLVAMAGPLFELVEAMRSGDYDARLPRLPRLPAPDLWNGLYRDHRAVSRAVFDAAGGLGGGGAGVQRTLDEARAVSVYERRHPGRISGGLVRVYGRPTLAGMFYSWQRAGEKMYRIHLRELRREIRSGFRGDDGPDLGERVAADPALYFYVRAVLPAGLAYRTTLQRLLRTLRSHPDPADRADAAEKLVRLDPRALTLPDVAAWQNAADGAVRAQREAAALRWRGQGLGTGRFDRAGFKAVLGSAALSLAQRQGQVLTLRGTWDACTLTAAGVRGLFHAAERDRVALTAVDHRVHYRGDFRERGVFDPDLGDMQAESWSRQLRRYRPDTDALFPVIGPPPAEDTGQK